MQSVIGFGIWMCRLVSDMSGGGGVGSDLQTWCWRRRRGVEMNPCSPSSSRTAWLLWTRTRSGRRPPSHRPQSFCLEEEEQKREAESSGHMTKQRVLSKLNQHKENAIAEHLSNVEPAGGLWLVCILTSSWRAANMERTLLTFLHHQHNKLPMARSTDIRDTMPPQ